MKEHLEEEKEAKRVCELVCSKQICQHLEFNNMYVAGFGCEKYNFDGIESDTVITAKVVNEEEKTMQAHDKYNYSVFMIPV